MPRRNLFYILTTLLSTRAQYTPANNKDDELLDWVIKNGGYWNPKLELGIDDESGEVGVYVKEAIDEDEVLLKVPWNVVIEQPEDKDYTPMPDVARRLADCGMVMALKEEFDKGDASEFSVYTKSLKKSAKTTFNVLPAHWTDEGKELLKQVMNITGFNTAEEQAQLPPHDMFLTQFEWKRDCEEIDPISTLLVMTHGEDFGMTPIIDRFNSKITEDVYFQKSDVDAIHMSAERSLNKGEQIYVDYRGIGQIGTPDLLRDFGFVEGYPQLWIFHDIRLAFYLHEDRKVVWIHKYDDVMYYNPHHKQPSRAHEKFIESGIAILKHHHCRLKYIVCPEIRTRHPEGGKHFGPTQRELNVALQFCDAYMIALEAAQQDFKGFSNSQ